MKKKTEKTVDKSLAKILFTVVLDDGSKLSISGDQINKFTSTDKRKFTVQNAQGVTIFKKTFKG